MSDGRGIGEQKTTSLNRKAIDKAPQDLSHEASRDFHFKVQSNQYTTVDHSSGMG
jgi:hypothetical protein